MQVHTRTILMAAVLLGAGLLLGELRAQPAGRPEAAGGGAAGRVAVVNIVKVFNEFQQTKELNTQFEQRRQEVQLEVDSRDREIELKARELEAFHPDSTDYNQRRRELLRLQIDRDNYMRLAEIDVRDQFKTWTERTYEMVCTAAAKVAERHGFDLVLTSEDLNTEVPDANALKQQIRLRHVIYADDRADITAEVLDMLNHEYKQKDQKPNIGRIGP